MIPVLAHGQAPPITAEITGVAIIDGETINVRTNSGVDANMAIITFTFSESVTGFTAADIQRASVLGNSQFQPLTGSGAVYTFPIIVNQGQSDQVSARLDRANVFDLAGNPRIVNATAYTISFSPAPVPTISSTTVDHRGATDADIIQFNVRFSEHISGLEDNDISVTSTAPAGTHRASGFPSGTSGTSFNFRVESGLVDGTIRVQMPANRVIDLNKVGNVASNVYIATFGPQDNEPPTVLLSADVANNTGTIADRVRFTATFSEVIPEGLFTQEDIVLSSTAPAGTHTVSAPVASGTDGTAFTFDVPRNDAEGTITVSIPEGAVTDFAGNDVGQSDPYQVSFGVRPVVITANVGDNDITTMDTVTFTATFRTPIRPDTFEIDDIIVDSTAPPGTHRATVLAGSGDTYTFDVLRNNVDGTIMVSIPEDSIVHTDDFINEASNVYSVIFNTGQPISAFLTDTTPADANGKATFTVLFGDAVTGFGLDDIIVDSDMGTHVPSNLVQVSGNTYTFDVLRGATDATITVSIQAGAVMAGARTNSASNDHSFDLELNLVFDYVLAELEPRAIGVSEDIDFTHTGNRMFILNGGDLDRIHRYTLGSDNLFDISEAPDSADQTYDITRDTAPRAIEFSDTARRMFMLGTTTDSVYELTLMSPFILTPPPDLSFTFPLSAATTGAQGLEFSRDGTHMYVIDSGGDGGRIYGFSLGTGFDLESGNADEFVTSPALQRLQRSLAVNDDGTIMYVLAATHLYAYTFGVAYDVSTLSLEASQQLTDNPARGMAFSSDFETLHVVGFFPDNAVSEFTLNSEPVLGPATLSIAESSNVNTLSPIPGSDPDGDTLAYRISGNPGWLSIDGNTGQLSGLVPQDNSPNFRNTDTPARCDLDGSVTFTVTVSDDGFDTDDTDDVSRVYTITITNTARINNSSPAVVDGEGIQLFLGAEQLDLSVYSTDSDGDTLTYFDITANDNTAFDGDSIRIDRNTGVATFTSLNAVGEAIIRYMVCDGSVFSELAVSTITPAPLEIIPDQTINEGQTLDSLNLNITSDTASPLFNVTQISIEGDIVPIFAKNSSIPISQEPLPELLPGDPDLNGTSPGGGSLGPDDLQRAFLISSIEELGNNDPRLDARIDKADQQILDGVPSDEQIDPYTITHTIPDDFVDAGLAQSPPATISYTYVLENGDVLSGIFDLVVNRTDDAPVSTLPTSYVLNPTDDTMVINLAEHFTDPEGDNILYNVTNPNPGIANVTLVAGMLSIDPVSSGTTNIRLCAESVAPGITNAVYCESFLVAVRDATTRSDIFLESSVTVYYSNTAQSVTLDASDLAIDPAIQFERLIITADNAAATGEIQINRTGNLINSARILTNSSGEISYNPESAEDDESESVTFTAVLHDLVQDSRITSEEEILISVDTVPLLHDDITVNYVLRFVDAAPNALVGRNDLPPRHTTDIYSIPIDDLFEDPDNSRPGGLDVTITNIANPGALNAVIIDDILRVTPRSDSRNAGSSVTFALDDGTNTVRTSDLTFRFRVNTDEAAPAGFPQRPVTTYLLPPQFAQFEINLAELFVNDTRDGTDPADNTFIDDIEILNVDLPELSDGAADTSKINATFDNNIFEIAPGTNFAPEVITFDIFLAGTTQFVNEGGSTNTPEYRAMRLFQDYRLAFVPMVALASAPSDSGGGDDSRWKSKATFGKSYSTGLKSVDCGYSMDNICRDVTDYHVDYLRESIETDSLHDFALKTSAPNGLRSLGIAFGVPGIGSSLNAAEAQVDVTLERDYTLNSTYRIADVSYTNENSVIGEDAGFSIHKSKCLPSDAEPECVTLNIEGVQFREQMYHAPFVIHAMDARGYVTIHYMNDGLLISGDSLNEAPTHDLTAKLAHQRDLAQLSLTRTDKLSDIWTDQFGYTWTKNSYGTWSYVEGPKIVVSPICDDPDKRVCNAFAQKLAAYNIQMENLRDSLYGKAYTMPAFDDLHETVTIYDIDGDSRERFLADNDLLWLLE